MLQEEGSAHPGGGSEWTAQQFWGPRHIDDAVLRRIDADGSAGYERSYYYLTDAQFSPVALIDSATGQLVERVAYDAYGQARHRCPGDVNGDGFCDSTDSGLINDLGETSPLIDDAGYDPECDLNQDGQIDGDDLDEWQRWDSVPALAAGLLSDPAGPDSPVGYGGYLFNREAKLYTVRHRSYDPVLGRMLQRDPAGHVDGMNLYEYVGSDPLMMLDPMGLNGAIASAVARNREYQAQVMASFRSGEISGEQASRLINMAGSAALRQIATGLRLANDPAMKTTASFKAVGNSASNTLGSAFTLGLKDGPDLFAVNEYERDAGYDGAYIAARISHELAVGIATGAASKLGSAGKAVMLWDAAGNGVSIGRGINGVIDCGELNWENGLLIAGGLAGASGNLWGPAWANRTHVAEREPLDWSIVTKKGKTKGETRWEHIKKHALDNPNKPLHGVFDNDPVLITQEAWHRAQRNGIAPRTVGGVDLYMVPMGRRVGWQGGQVGNRDPLSSVKIVTEQGTSRIITSHPY